MTLDLRKHRFDDVIDRVQRAFDTRFDMSSEVRKRRSIGFRTHRATWVRIEAQPVEKMGQRYLNGVEVASILEGVAKPAWHGAVSWIQSADCLLWHADETDFVEASVVKPGGTLTVDPGLPQSWWADFNRSMDALAGHVTARAATPTLTPMTQERFTATIHKIFPEVDTTIDEWTAAHGDFAWANITAPEFCILDWEDWGMAPRGFDAAYLHNASLAVPALADRICDERRADMDSRTGRLCQLYMCARVIDAPPDWSGPLLEPAKRIARDVLNSLER